MGCVSQVQPGGCTAGQPRILDTLKWTTTCGLFCPRINGTTAALNLELSGVVFHADDALGDEGAEFILLSNYLWRLLSVDNPS